MLNVHKQTLAEDDLIGIWLYSFEQWGADQADAYLDKLQAGIDQLARNPTIGKACDHIRRSYRRLHVERHLIYYRVIQNRIEIVRVLHDSMEPDLHL